MRLEHAPLETPSDLAYPEAEQHLTALLDELRERSRGRVNHEVLGGAVVALFSRIVESAPHDPAPR